MAVLYKINDKKVLFIHIPKTGGGSIDTALAKFRIKEPRIEGHPSLEQCANIVEADYKFTVIRNPWDWRASWFHYLREGNSGHNYELIKTNGMTFKEHLKWIANEPIENFTKSQYNDSYSQLFIKPQSEYIDETVKVLRLENLEIEFNEYMKEIGVDIGLKQHVRKSSNYNYIQEYDDESIEIVRKLAEKDIAKFGYTFKNE